MEGRVLKTTEPEAPRLPTRGNHPREEGGGDGGGCLEGGFPGHAPRAHWLGLPWGSQ